MFLTYPLINSTNCGSGGVCGNIQINNQRSTPSRTTEFVQINTVPAPATIWLIVAAALGFIRAGKLKKSLNQKVGKTYLQVSQ